MKPVSERYISDPLPTPGGVLMGILGVGVPPGSPNPDPISEKKCNFRHPFTEQTSKIHTRFLIWPSGILSFQTLRTEQKPYPMERHIPIACFHSRDQHLCEFIETRESLCIRKEFNSHMIGLGHQNGRRFIVLGHQYGRRDVMWKHSI